MARLFGTAVPALVGLLFAPYGYAQPIASQPAFEVASIKPRADIRGIGNRLRHTCDRIALDTIWDVSPTICRS